jgi:predicted nucleotidyltransferase
MRPVRDRDFLRTSEGLLFCVVGYLHPADRVVSYLKYAPHPEGLWGRGAVRYSRTMPTYTTPSLLDNIEVLRRRYPHYVFHSPVFNVTMSAVPWRNVAEVYYPERKLRHLLTSPALDPLQTTTVELAQLIADESGASTEQLGVTGSLLTDIHQPRFSDVDFTVHGRDAAHRVKRALTRLLETDSAPLRRHSDEGHTALLHRWAHDYPLSLADADEVYARRWNYGFYRGRAFSVHPIRGAGESTETYGDRIFHPGALVRGTCVVVGADDSMFLPGTYAVDHFQARVGAVDVTVSEVVSYDGLYCGIYEVGDAVAVHGKLERVVPEDGDAYYRVVVGSLEARGMDYIKPTSGERA